MLKRKIFCVVFCLFLLLGLALSSFSPAVAASQPSPITLEQAMSIAKQKLDIPDSFNTSMSYYSNYEETQIPVWTIYYSDGIHEHGHNLNVEIHAYTGDILRFGWGVPESNEPIKYNREEAQQFADKFLQRILQPEEYEQLYLSKSHYYDLDEFKYKRVVKGYPFLDDGIEVSVDYKSGKVISFRKTWSDSSNVIAPAQLLSRREAAKKFCDTVGLELGYATTSYYDQEQQRKEKIVIAYYPRISRLCVNAVTGELNNEFGNKITAPVVQEYKPISESVITASSKPVNMEQAMAKAREAAKVPGDFILKSNSFMDGTWYFSWGPKDSYEREIGVQVEQKTGEIMGLYYPWSAENNSVKDGLSRNEAREKAVSYVQDLLPSKVHLLGIPKTEYGWVYTNEDRNLPQYQFYFPMLVKGLPFMEKGVSITVKSDGTLLSYETRWGEFEFPDKKNIISETEAKKIFERRFINNLSYIKFGYDETSQTIPAYSIGSQYGELRYINADTGLIINADGVLYDDNRVVNGIQGHWAGRDIARLTSMGVIESKDGYFDPNESVTRAEMVRMLVKALVLNPSYPSQGSFADVPKSNLHMGYIEAGKAEGIIYGSGGYFKPESYLSREEMAVILSKVVTQSEAEQKLTGFKDSQSISSWAKSGVDIAVQSGLVKGDEKGFFNPKKNVTYGEMSALLARLIERTD